MSDVVYWIINMSIMGSVTGVVILLLRRIRQLPVRLIYLLWGIPFIRMIMPIGISTRYSLMNVLSQWSVKTVVVQNEKASDISLTTSNYLQMAKDYEPLTYKADILEAVFTVAFYVWIIIASALIIGMMIIYFRALTEIKSSVQKGNYYVSPVIQCPSVYGMLCQKIIIPEKWPETNLHYVLLHEEVHKHRHDNIWRMAALIICCINWFNPFAWIMLRFFMTDMELSCDESVISRLNREEQGNYAQVILDAASEKISLASTFGGASIRLRILNIVSYKKISIMSACILILFTVIVTVTLLTNASVR